MSTRGVRSPRSKHLGVQRARPGRIPGSSRPFGGQIVVDIMRTHPMIIIGGILQENPFFDAERASAIIERVRGLAKRSSPEQVPLRLVDVVVALAAAESAARRVAIRTDVAADLPLVLGDRVQLLQVLLNLVVNGMDAMSTVDEPERKLEIRGRLDTQDGRPAARISVQDRGIGLHAGQADRLFEAFYTTKPHGMGMGLAISRSIIEAHGGRLWAESNRGPGATFSFRLPAAAASAAA